MMRNSSDGQVERVSASVAVDSGLIRSLVKPMSMKLVFTSSLLDAQHMGRVENKPASLLVVSLERALKGNNSLLEWYTNGRQLLS